MSERTKPNDHFTDYATPWVEPIPGEPFRYRVESASTNQPHTVDLTERDGHGACSCEFWYFTANPNFKRIGKWIPYAPHRNGVTECRHLRAAFDRFHLDVTQPMLARFRAGIPRS